jgi:hypothetical protein
MELDLLTLLASSGLISTLISMAKDEDFDEYSKRLVGTLCIACIIYSLSLIWG